MKPEEMYEEQIKQYIYHMPKAIYRTESLKSAYYPSD